MQTKDELIAKIMAMAQDYKQIKLSSPTSKPLQLDAFTKEEVQGLNAKLKQFEGIKDKIKDKAALDEAGKILAEELKTLIPAFLAKYVGASEGQQKQLAGVKAKAEAIIKNISIQQTDTIQGEPIRQTTRIITFEGKSDFYGSSQFFGKYALRHSSPQAKASGYL